MNSKDIKKTATVLKFARKRAKISQAQLSRITGLNQAVISKVENGKEVASKHYPVLARALKVDPATLQIPAKRGDCFWALCRNSACEHFPVSYQHKLTNFDVVNFCFACGGPYVKECASCGNKIVGDRGDEYCFCDACGKALFSP